jgi:methionine sulfoxide reductase heme-binding subunit
VWQERVHPILVRKWTKPLLFLLCLVPLVLIAAPFFNGATIPDPAAFIQHATGDWILRLLCITLAITPTRRILALPELIRFRRMLGLFAFFYACLHFFTYIGFDKLFDLSEIWKDVAKRRYITVGFLAFLLLIPLAITSTAGWVRRLGGRRWQMLHRAIYVAAVCGVIHYYWLVKSAVIRPLAYGALVTLLLGWRLRRWLSQRAAIASPETSSLRARANAPER